MLSVPMCHVFGLRGRVSALAIELVIEVQLKVVRLMRERRSERAEVGGEAPVGFVEVCAVCDGRLYALVAEARYLSLHVLRILPGAREAGRDVGPRHVLAFELDEGV